MRGDVTKEILPMC